MTPTQTMPTRDAVDVAATAVGVGGLRSLTSSTPTPDSTCWIPTACRPIEVAYIRDQKTAAASGFRFVSPKQKRVTGEDDAGGVSNDVDDVDVAVGAGAGNGEAASSSLWIPKDGECTFHIIPRRDDEHCRLCGLSRRAGARAARMVGAAAAAAGRTSSTILP